MSLLVWLPLNGTLENWGSSPAKFKLTNTSGALGIAAAGKTAANCYRRSKENTADYIKSDINFTLDGDVSMACWCKITGYGSTNSANGIITQHGHRTGGLGITMRYVGANDYRMSVNTGTKGDDFPEAERDRTYKNYYGNTNIYNAWHHLCLTYQASTKQLRIYVDGKLDRDVVTLSGNNTTARPFSLFDWSTDHSSNASYRPPCYLNDVRLYDNCLSSKEIKLLSQGLVAHYKLDVGGNNNLLLGSWDFSGSSGGGTVSMDDEGWYKKSYTHPAGSSSYKDFCQWSNVQTVNANEIYTVSFLAKSSDSTKNLIVYFYNNNSGVQVSNITSSQGHNKSGTDGNCQLTLTNEWKRYWITWKFNGTTTALKKTLLFRILAAGGNVQLAQVKLEKSAKATNYSLNISETNFTVGDDCSGYGNNGIAAGTWSFDSDSPRHSCCAVFNGSDTKIDLSIKSLMQSLLQDKCTINFWVNETDISSRSVYFGGYNGSNFNIESTTAGKLRVYWNGSPDLKVSSISNGVWTMFTIVIDVATGIKIYKDGVIAYTHSGALNDITSGFTNNTFRLGSDSRSGETMAECKMSDFRIYCSALSEKDIETLYKSVGSIAKNGALMAYDFEERARSNAKIHKDGIFAAEDFSEVGLVLRPMKTKVLSDGSVWARIYWLDTTTLIEAFANVDEVKSCNKSNRFSKLGLIDQYKGENGAYEFMLTYPRLSTEFNRWSQTSSPNVAYSAATGFTKITTASWSKHFAPMHKVTNSKYSGNSVYALNSNDNWWAPIGQMTIYQSVGIPAASGNVQTETELWVRIDTLPENIKTSIVKERFVSTSLLQEI